MSTRNRLSRLLGVLAVTAACLSRSGADVFTSSVKMADLSRREGLLLNSVSGFDLDESFLKSRQEARSMTGEEASSHPNGAYLLIKAFVQHWNNIIHDRNDLKQVVESAELPTDTDLGGSLAALLRLHRVYKLAAAQMYNGNISGFTGPPLTPIDAVAMGRRAFTDGMLKQSVEWLTLANEYMKVDSPSVELGIIATQKHLTEEQGQTLGLLGRVYLLLNDKHAATQLYHQSSLLAEDEGDVEKLGQELSTASEEYVEAQQWDIDSLLDGVNQLCTRTRSQMVGDTRPYHSCRYKTSLHVPYRMYKEEVLSLDPYASIFHDALTQRECDHLKKKAMHNLTRAGLYYHSGEEPYYGDYHGRTGEFFWISDNDDPTVRGISRRVMDMTWLDVNDGVNSELASAEMLQVLNYGLGGHFSPHLDTFEDQSERCLLSGKRIATFLFYLEDVEEGGSTVFTDVDMSVSPAKGRGLFWYNAKPNGDIDPETIHAGCPVLKGHKWIANKWIWTEGNMYRRPCGPRPESTQLDVEKITYSRRHNIPFP